MMGSRRNPSLELAASQPAMKECLNTLSWLHEGFLALRSIVCAYLEANLKLTFMLLDILQSPICVCLLLSESTSEVQFSSKKHITTLP